MLPHKKRMHRNSTISHRAFAQCPGKTSWPPIVVGVAHFLHSAFPALNAGCRAAMPGCGRWRAQGSSQLSLWDVHGSARRNPNQSFWEGREEALALRARSWSWPLATLLASWVARQAFQDEIWILHYLCQRKHSLGFHNPSMKLEQVRTQQMQALFTKL